MEGSTRVKEEIKSKADGRNASNNDVRFDEESQFRYQPPADGTI